MPRTDLERAIALTLVASTILTACHRGSSPEPSTSDSQAREGGSSGIGRPPPGEILASADIGTLPGNVGVGQGGELQYSVPLALPPGPHGLQPGLSFQYNAGAYSNMGIGWSLGGLSAISRCRDTLGRDGLNRQIEWSTQDNLCIDGEELVSSHGHHGDSGTEYRPRSMPLLRVVATGNSDQPFSSFIAYRPDGSRAEYGRSDAATGGGDDAATLLARPGAGRLVPSSWWIRRIVDRFGNQIEFEYAKQLGEADGELDRNLRIDAINYGRNDTAGTPHTRGVRFGYRDVYDEDYQSGGYDNHSMMHWGFVAGQQTEQRYLLEEVSTHVHGAMVHSYRVDYEAVPESLDGDPGDARFYARAMEVCDAQEVCLPETTFQWSKGPGLTIDQAYDIGFDGTPFYPQPPVSELVQPDPQTYMRAAAQVTGDFDADGDLDMLVSPEPMNLDGIWNGTWELWRTDLVESGPALTNVSAIWNDLQYAQSPVGAGLPPTDLNAPISAQLPGPEDYAMQRRLDEKAPPLAFAVDYDGTHGTDVLVGVPASELAGAFMDPPWGLGRHTLASRGSTLHPDLKPTRHRADFAGHPGIMRDLKVLKPVYGGGATFTETSLGYDDPRPILWAYPVDLDGDGLSDLMFCQANEDYENTPSIPVAYDWDDEDKRHWLSGKVRYALNLPGQGIDLSAHAAVYAPSGEERCHFKDYLYIADTHGDGRQQLLRVRFDGNALGSPLIDVYDPIYDPDDPNYDPTAPGLNEAIQERFETIDPGTYQALTYDAATGTFAKEDTGLPFDSFLRWKHTPGNNYLRYSGWRYPAFTDGNWDLGPTPHDIRKMAITEFGEQPTNSGGIGHGRQGDFNGDGLVDFLFVDITRSCVETPECIEYHSDSDTICVEWEQPLQHACSNWDIYQWGKNQKELEYESLGVVVYWNTGAGFRAGGIFRDLWNGEQTDPYLATREWQHEWNSAVVADRNQDAVSDLFLVDLEYQPEQPNLYCANIASCPDHAGDVMFKRYPLTLLGSRSGASHRAYAGPQLDALVDDVDPDDLHQAWGYDLLNVPGAGDGSSYPAYLYQSLEEFVKYEDDNLFSHVTRYEAHQAGLSIRTLFTDIDRDGDDDVMIYDHNHGRWEWGWSGELDEPEPYLLIGVTNGLGEQTRVEYTSLAAAMEPWSVESNLGNQMSGTPGRRQVVSALLTDTGLEDGDQPLFNRTEYHYEGVRADTRRSVNLGFTRRWMRSTLPTEDGTVDTTIVERYDNQSPFDAEFGVYPHAGTLVSRVTWTTKGFGAVHVAHEGYRRSAHPGHVYGTWRTQTDASYSATYQLDGLDEVSRDCLLGAIDAAAECDLSESPLTHIGTTFGYDAYGDVTSEETHTGEQASTTHRRYVQNDDLANYVMGMLTTESITHQPHPDASSVQRITVRGYDALHRVSRVTIEPGRPQYRSWIDLQYSLHGNIIRRQRFSDADAAGSQVTLTGYDPDGVHTAWSLNALGHVTTMSWFPGCGAPERVTDAVGRSTVNDIDGFCRPRARQGFFGDVPLGPRLDIAYSEHADDGLYPDRELLVRSTVDGGASSVTISDRLGRTYRSESPSFDFDTYTLVDYDRLGEARRISLPTLIDQQPAGWTTTLRDALGRTIQSIRPDGETITKVFDQRVTRHTDELGRVTTTTADANGQVVRIAPPLDPEQPQFDYCYQYAAFGVLAVAGPCVATPLRTPTVVEVDDYGRQISVSDGQLGARHTAYDAFGRIEDVTDAKGQITRFRYDALDRQVGRTEAFGTSEAKTAAWVFDEQFPGLLTRAVNGDATVVSEPRYDELARLVGTNTTIHGRLFRDDLSYDPRGRVDTITYPSPVAGTHVQISTTYNGRDQVESLTRLGAAEPLWEPVTYDVFGHLTHQRYGNGVETQAMHEPLTGALSWVQSHGPALQLLQRVDYQWHPDGRLHQRTRDGVGGAADQSERFAYNPRGELRRWTIEAGAASESHDMDYDGLGSILSGPAGIYGYAGERLQAVVGGGPPVVYPAYDDNGNLLRRIEADEVTELTYDALDRVAAIDSDDESATFTYDADGAKVHILDKVTGRETFRLGDYEEERGGDLDAAVVARHRVGAVAHIVRTWADEGAPLAFSEQVTFLQPADHLGAASLVTDDGGAVVEERSYGAWGAPREPADWFTDDDAALTTAQLNQGFGGTEGRRYGGGDLVHMGARVYDQQVGRFLQADTLVPVIAEPLDWNRYAFVRNAPTAFVDPSGHAPQCPAGLSIGCWDGTQERMPWAISNTAFGSWFMQAYGYSVLEARSGLAEVTMMVLPSNWKLSNNKLYHYGGISINNGPMTHQWTQLPDELMPLAIATFGAMWQQVETSWNSRAAFAGAHASASAGGAADEGMWGSLAWASVKVASPVVGLAAFAWENPGLAVELGVGATPAGLVVDAKDVGVGAYDMWNGQWLYGGLGVVGGLIGLVPIIGDGAKAGIKGWVKGAKSADEVAPLFDDIMVGTTSKTPPIDPRFRVETDGGDAKVISFLADNKDAGPIAGARIHGGSVTQPLVVLHGNGAGRFSTKYGMSVTTLATALKDLTPNAMAYRLMSCGAGNGSNSAAQLLSNLTGKPVYVPYATTSGIHNSNGSLWQEAVNPATGGMHWMAPNWRIFHPE